LRWWFARLFLPGYAGPLYRPALRESAGSARSLSGTANSLDGGEQCMGARQAVLRSLGEQAVDDFLIARQRRRKARHRCAHVLAEDFLDRLAVEWPGPREHLEEDHAQA